MIQFNRNHIVLVWKNIKSDTKYCIFCTVRDTLKGTHLTRNCPIGLNVCNCNSVENRRVKQFDNSEDVVLATVYYCNMKGTVCHRECNLCTIHHIITKVNDEMEHL